MCPRGAISGMVVDKGEIISPRLVFIMWVAAVAFEGGGNGFRAVGLVGMKE